MYCTALGICVSLCCCWLCGIPAIILAAIAMSKRRGSPADIRCGQTTNTIGLVLGVIGLVCGCIWIIYYIIILFGNRSASSPYYGSSSSYSSSSSSSSSCPSYAFYSTSSDYSCGCHYSSYYSKAYYCCKTYSAFYNCRVNGEVQNSYTSCSNYCGY